MPRGNPWLPRLQRAYAALGKAPAEPSPMARLHPSTVDREHLTASPFGLSALGGLEADAFAAHAKVYASYVWVRKAVGAITTPLAPLPLRVVDAAGKPVSHDLNALFEQPNDQMDGATLREHGYIHLLLGGEWFREVVDDARGRPRELWPRRPDAVQVAPDESRIAYPAPAGYRIPEVGEALLPTTAVIHGRLSNPLSSWRGISVIGAAREEIAVDLLTLLNTQRTLKDGTRSYAITAADVLAPQERARVEAELYAKYGRNRPMLLEGGQDVKVFSSSPDDLEWLEARNYSREAIGALFNVPDEIMGFGRDTYENFETARKVLWLQALLPLAQRHDAVMTHFFTRVRPLLSPGQRIATDFTGVPELQEALGPKLEQATQLFGLGVPYNTVERILRLGTGPIPGGDVGYLPANLIPVDGILAPAPAPTPRALAAAALKSASTRRDEQALRQALREYLAEQYDIAARAAEEG